MSLPDRHLVLDATGQHTEAAGWIVVACQGKPALYDRTIHTYLTALATCADCLAVHAAWLVAFQADLNSR